MGREALVARGERPAEYVNTAPFFLSVGLSDASAAYNQSASAISDMVSRADSALSSDLHDRPPAVVSVSTAATYEHDFGYGPYAYVPGSSLTAGGTVFLPTPSRGILGVSIDAAVLLTGSLVIDTELGTETFTFSNQTPLDLIAAGISSSLVTATVRERALLLTPADHVRCVRVRQTQLAKILGLAKSQLQTARGYIHSDLLARALNGSVERSVLYSGNITVRGSLLEYPEVGTRAILRISNGDLFIIDGGVVSDYANVLNVSALSADASYARGTIYTERVRVSLDGPATASSLPVGVRSPSSAVSIDADVEVGDVVGGVSIASISSAGSVTLSRAIDEGDHELDVVGWGELVRYIASLGAMLSSKSLTDVDAAIKSRVLYDRRARVQQYTAAWLNIVSMHTERGYDRAADLLRSMKLTDYLACTASSATYTTSIDDAIQEVSRAMYQA